MAMARGTSIVANFAAVANLTGQQGLSNIPVASELVPATLLVTASDTIYDRLEMRGVDPTLLTNEEIYERAVAWQLLAILAQAGLLIVDGESAVESAARYQRMSDHAFDHVKPKSTATDMPRIGDNNIPRIANLHKKSQITRDEYFDDIQRRR